MEILLSAIRRLLRGDAVTASEIHQIVALGLPEQQLAPLAFLVLSRRTANWWSPELIETLRPALPNSAPYLAPLFPEAFPGTHTPASAENANKVIAGTHRYSALGESLLAGWIESVVSGDTPTEAIAIWLAKVCLDGLSPADVRHLTTAMVGSGDQFDYRDCDALDNRKVIRRYPTGALSEKVALILPSLLSWASRTHPIVSPFLVARSLGFTGGTWDKLSTIEGFEFPEHGQETIRTLQQCGIAMTVTHGALDPADRILYRLRSVTGTIESPELIVSSIASKQLAVPADHLLLDVRFGSGAFLQDRTEAQEVSLYIEKVIREGGVDCFSELTSAEQPGGMSVGNAVEVLEALAVMGSQEARSREWDSRGLAEQSEIVIQFYSRLMARAFPETQESSFSQEARQALADGEVLRSFWDLLRSHRVSEEYIRRLASAPEDELLRGLRRKVIYADVEGPLRGIDQRRLGHAVNFVLGSGGNEYGGNIERRAGVILHKRAGAVVRVGDPLAEVFYGAASVSLEEVVENIRPCFLFEP